jgi:peptidoglycan/LPS O-acetylase OafA/YrhL
MSALQGDASNDARRIEALDGVRGLALLGVLGQHTFGFGCGWVGLLFFFVLSGYLITRGLLERRHLPAGRYFGGFYRRRAARILPLYWLWLLVVALIFLWRREPPRFLTELPFLATFTVNLTRFKADWSYHPLITHLWSLSVEEQFYLVWPLALRWLSERRILTLSVVLIMLAPLARLSCAAVLDDGTREAWAVADTVYWFTPSQMDGFALGALVAVVTRVWPTTRRFSQAMLPLLALVLGLGLLVLKNPTRFGHEHLDGWTLGYPLAPRTAGFQHVWVYTVLDLFAASVIGALVGPVTLLTAPLHAVLGMAWLRELGRVSYGIYIVHWAVAWLIWQTSVFPPWAFGGYVLIVYLVAAASSRWFEGPLLRRFGSPTAVPGSKPATVR